MYVTDCIKTGFRKMMEENPVPPVAGVGLLALTALTTVGILYRSLKQEALLLEHKDNLSKAGTATPDDSHLAKELWRMTQIQLGTVAALIAQIAVTCGVFYYQGCRKG